MTNGRKVRAQFLMAGVCLAGLSTPALAEDGAAATMDANAAADPQATDGVEIEEIVITATKRETNLQDTPIAISVINDELIKTRHVQSLLDLQDGGVPSLRIAPFESRQSALTIGMRGIVPLDANQPAREQGVGVYIDGVYLGRQHGLNAGLLDIERIEVLRGPQGTLFGRNAEGGAVNMVSRAPTGEFGGRAAAGFGNFGSYSANAHIDLPAIAGIAFKIDGMIQHQNATVKNPMEGELGWGGFHRYGGRIAARWKPVDALTVDLAYDIGRDENTPQYSQLINYNPNGYTGVRPLPPLVVVTDERMKVADLGLPQQASVSKADGLMGVVKYRFSNAAELRSITAWRSVKDDQWDNSGGAHRPPVFTPNCTGNACNFSRYSLSQLNQHQFSQEVQLVGSLPQVDYVAGLYYFDEFAEDAAATPNTARWNADGTGYTILDPCTGSAGFGSQPGCRSLDRASRAWAKSYAAYGQFTWTPAGLDQLHLTIGGRYTIDKKNGILYKVSNADTNLTFRLKSDRFDPLVTLAYDVTPDVNVYAKFATGYRAGGASSRSLTYRSFGPEKVKSYEIGLKSDLFDRRVRFNLAGYIMDRTGSQIDFNFYNPVTNRNTLETVNAPGTTKIRGIEAELTARPADGLTLGLSYAYTHAKVPQTPNPLRPDNAVQPVYIVFTPPHALSGSIDYAVPVASNGPELRFHMDANYSDAVYSFDSEDVKTDSSFIVNARLSLAEIPMSDRGTTAAISLWSRNLFNEAHIYRRSAANSLPNPNTGSTSGIIGDYANYNTPRTFGIEGTLKF